MSKVKYYYDSENLAYKRIKPQRRKKFAYAFLFLLAAALFGFLCLILLINTPYIETPKELTYEEAIETNSIFNLKEFINNNPNHDSIQGSIAFKNVSFTYDDTNIQALKNISFEVKKGETLAILGKTGCGKSTILSLICRLYDVENGSITMDGKKLADLNLHDLRNSIGIVPQDAFLFSESIKNNIKFGKEDASDEEVIEAAKKSVVHDNIINFKNQYDTVLGERGITLSGGQKQRVSIARAIIKDPEILLFDDCLSAVDTETEEQILNNLFEICKIKTTLIVSHRVSSAKNADKIIILEEGEIIQQGSHFQLLNQEGYYKELYLKQLSEKELS